MSDTDLGAVEPPVADDNASLPETPEPVAAETTEGSEADSSPAVKDTDDFTKAAKGLSKRVDELTRNWRLEQQRTAQLMEMLQRQQPKATEPPAVPETSKTRADFEFDEAKYQSYLFTEAEKRAVAAAERRIREQQDQEKAGRRKTEFERRESDYAKSVEDYIEVTRNPAVPINSDMAQVIAESDDGPALAYYLGKNVEIAERISQLSPLAAAREMGRIEAKLAAEREKAKEKTVSKAPAPTPKLEAGNDAPTVRTTDSSGDSLPDDEWFRLERKRLSRRK